MTIFNKRKVCGTLPYMKLPKRLWRLLSENNIVYDIFKFAMFSVWPWFFGLVTVAFLMFHGWLKAQPLGFFAMLLIFALAFLLAAAALISRDKAQLNLPLSKYKMIGIGALLFLGVPILLFGLSRVPLTYDQIQIASDEQPKPKLEEPKIEKLTAEATPELEKKSPKEVELQSKRGIVKESEPAKETIISQLEAAEPPLIPPGTRIEQRSEGPNSPNIIGNNNQVNIK